MKNNVLAQAVDCCLRFDCSGCPMMDGMCDEPFVAFVQMPVPLMEQVKKELEEESEAKRPS